MTGCIGRFFRVVQETGFKFLVVGNLNHQPGTLVTAVVGKRTYPLGGVTRRRRGRGNCTSASDLPSVSRRHVIGSTARIIGGKIEGAPGKRIFHRHGSLMVALVVDALALRQDRIFSGRRLKV